MTEKAFLQTSSLLLRLRTLVIMVSAFFIIGLLGLFLSNNKFVASLSDVNRMNKIYDAVVQLREGMNTSTISLQKLFTTGKDRSDAHAMFLSGQKIMEDKMNEAIRRSEKYPTVYAEWKKIQTAREHYFHAATDLFKKLESLKKKENPEKYRSDLLIASEYDLEIRESLLKMQFELKKYSDEAFQLSYQKRHLPTIVGLVITLLSLTYVGVMGTSIYRNFDRSIHNLVHVTEKVARGNLDTHAKILKQDEIGNLTYAFNQMVQSLRENNEQLNQAILAREDFLSIASHELKTPLTPLKLQLMLLTKHADKGTLTQMTPENLHAMVKKIDLQIDRLERLINDLLDVTKIRAGRLGVHLERFDLSELVNEVVLAYSPQFKQAQSPLEVQIQPNIVGELDRSRLEQALVNLLINALKYAPGKQIIVSLTKNGNWAQLSVQDHGPGIAEDDKKRIFDRFERVKARDNIGGLGLGLYISNQITKAFGGKISVSSELGKGATFTITLPLEASQELLDEGVSVV